MSSTHFTSTIEWNYGEQEPFLDVRKENYQSFCSERWERVPNSQSKETGHLISGKGGGGEEEGEVDKNIKKTRDKKSRFHAEKL